MLTAPGLILVIVSRDPPAILHSAQFDPMACSAKNEASGCGTLVNIDIPDDAVVVQTRLMADTLRNGVKLLLAVASLNSIGRALDRLKVRGNSLRHGVVPNLVTNSSQVAQSTPLGRLPSGWNSGITTQQYHWVDVDVK